MEANLLSNIIQESLMVIYDPDYPKEFRDQIREILKETREDVEKMIIQAELMEA